MAPITNLKELNASIMFLEHKQAQEELLLKEQFKITLKSIEPANFIKNMLKDLVTSPDFKEDLLNVSISIALGYFSKKLAIGSTNNPFKQILGNFLQMSVTSLLSKNMDDISTKFMKMLSVVFQKKVK
jgi:hypothetical protein